MILAEQLLGVDRLPGILLPLLDHLGATLLPAGKIVGSGDDRREIFLDRGKDRRHTFEIVLFRPPPFQIAVMESRQQQAAQIAVLALLAAAIEGFVDSESQLRERWRPFGRGERKFLPLSKLAGRAYVCIQA